jgi:hypothetical protein
VKDAESGTVVKTFESDPFDASIQLAESVFDEVCATFQSEASGEL